MKNNTQKNISFISSKFNKIKLALFVSVSILSISTSYGQHKNVPEINLTPNGIFDKVIDKEGNEYNLSDIMVAKPVLLKSGTTTVNTLLCTSGIFELYFETGSGMDIVGNTLHDQRRAILCQAFQDISDFINTPLKNLGNTNKVKFWIRNPNSLGFPANAAGGASSFYNLPSSSSVITSQYNGGIVDNEIWKTIQTGSNSYANTVFPILNTNTSGGFYHGWASFNFAGSVNWNLDYSKYDASTSYPLNYSDFYTTIVHEVTHALGFNSLINYNGLSQFYRNYGNYFTRYDKNLKTSSNVSLITNSPGTGGQMSNFYFNSVVSTTNLYPGCSLTPPTYNGNSGSFNCATAIQYVSNITVPVYNSACFENGSSLSHFEDACYNGNSNDQYFMMSERASGLYAKRALTAEERQVMCDIGYSVNGTFGNTSNFTYKNYGVTACSGVGVTGVNDGFLSSTGGYAFQGNSGTNISISGILNNDYTMGQSSNLRFEFVEDLYDPNAIFSVTTGNVATSFSLTTYVPGVHLLRYVPFDIATGQRGNITYVYVNVFNNCIASNSSNLVKNGDFEEHNFPPSNTSQIYKSCGWQNASYQPSAEYFNSVATNSSVGIPANFFGNQADKIVGNHAYVGMYIISGRPNVLENTYSESIKTELLNSLQPNTQYQLSFDVSMADTYLTYGVKFQAFITDANLELTTGGIIPASYITSDKVFLTNSVFSSSTSATNWETVTFTFTSSSNPNLKHLYIGGLSNVQFQNNGAQTYYYLDNVSLTPVVPSDLLETEVGDVNIFPNPSKNTVNITNNDKNIEHLTLCDIQSRILYTEKINKKEVQLDISNYPAGTYFIIISTEYGIIKRKLIKN